MVDEGRMRAQGGVRAGRFERAAAVAGLTDFGGRSLGYIASGGGSLGHCPPERIPRFVVDVRGENLGDALPLPVGGR